MDTDTQSGTRGLDTVPFILGVVLMGLVPFFVIPSGVIPLGAAKGLLLYTLVSALVIVAVLSILRRGTLTVPWTWWYVFPVLLPSIYLLASLLSTAPAHSLIGESFTVDTFSTILAGVVIMFSGVLMVRSSRNVLTLYSALGIGVLVVALFHGVRLIGGPGVLSFDRFLTPISSVVGSWNDLGILFGLVALSALVFLEIVPRSRWVRWVALVALIVPVFFIMLTQFTAVWYVLGIGALMVLLYRLSFAAGDQKRVSPTAVAVIIVALVFILAQGAFGDVVSNFFGVSHVDVRPSLGTTFDVAGNVVREHPLLGTGPNTFATQWLLFKPEGINTTAFWNVPFANGFGFIPSTLATTGVLGFAAWLAFFGFLIYWGARSLFYPARAVMTRYLILSSFVGAVYLWVFTILYPPGLVVMTLAFLFTSIFLAVLIRERIIPTKTFSLTKEPTTNFSITLGAVVLIIVTVVGVYGFAVRFIAISFHERGLEAARVGNITQAENALVQALRLAQTDQSYRVLADIQRTNLSILLATEEVSVDVLRSRFQTTLAATLSNAERAIVQNPDNHHNWITLARVYELLVPLRIPGAYENATGAYVEAQARNPQGPDMELLRARLEVAAGNNDSAREHVAQALALKPNYTDAIFLLSQIQIAEGNIDNAIASVEAATLIAPNNPVVFFQLGILRYNERDYRGAVGAFETAVTLNPIYANAKYFLGLSYDALGRRTDAVQQFEDVALLNPGNQEVEFILTNLRAGRDPFANVAPPLDDTPEARDTLPVEEPIIDDEPGDE